MPTTDEPNRRHARTAVAGRIAAVTVAAPWALTVLACGGGAPGATGPDPGPGPGVTGAVEVVTSSLAGGLDGDGFRVAVDGGPERTVGPDDMEIFASLAAGEHTVALSGVAPECTVEGELSRVVTAPAGDTVRVSFTSTCRLLDRIAFTSDRDGGFDVHLMREDGSGAVTTLTGDDAVDSDPSWSPDGTRIAFRSDRDGDADVWVVEVDGSNPTRLTDDDAFDSHPAWSPDGSRIAFTSERDGTKQDVYVMDADGSNVTRLTAGPEDDLRPSWSPDGSRIAFTSERDGNDEIYTVRADGSAEPVRLTDDAAVDGSPAWSPDGTHIAFTSNRDSELDFGIYVVCANGSAPPERRTEDAAADGSPTWSPDGTRIAFVSDQDDIDGDVWVMGADGSDPTSLASSPSVDSRPAWGPSSSSSGPGPIGPSTECQVASP